jgi:hypothetical protein
MTQLLDDDVTAAVAVDPALTGTSHMTQLLETPVIPVPRQPVEPKNIDSQETKPISVQLLPSQPASEG